MDDFYEDDEPIEDVRAAFAAGERGVTVSKPTRKSEDFVQRMKRVVDESTAEPEPMDSMQVRITRESMSRTLTRQQLDEVAARLHLGGR